jgi:hypothetical protein
MRPFDAPRPSKWVIGRESDQLGEPTAALANRRRTQLFTDPHGTMKVQGWEASEEEQGGVAFARKLLGFVGAFRTLCEAQKYAEAVDRAVAFFHTNAARAFYSRPTAKA